MRTRPGFLVAAIGAMVVACNCAAAVAAPIATFYRPGMSMELWGTSPRNASTLAETPDGVVYVAGNQLVGVQYLGYVYGFTSPSHYTEYYGADINPNFQRIGTIAWSASEGKLYATSFYNLPKVLQDTDGDGMANTMADVQDATNVQAYATELYAVGVDQVNGVLYSGGIFGLFRKQLPVNGGAAAQRLTEMWIEGLSVSSDGSMIATNNFATSAPSPISFRDAQGNIIRNVTAASTNGMGSVGTLVSMIRQGPRDNLWYLFAKSTSMPLASTCLWEYDFGSDTLTALARFDTGDGSTPLYDGVFLPDGNLLVAGMKGGDLYVIHNVPEPATALLLALGGLAILALRKRPFFDAGKPGH